MHHDQVGFSPGMQAWFNTQNQSWVTHQINSIRKRKPWDNSKWSRKGIWKFQHSFMILKKFSAKT